MASTANGRNHLRPRSGRRRAALVGWGGGPGPAPERPPGVGVWGMPSKIFLKKSCKNTAFERFLSNISQHKIGTHISNSQYKTVNVRKVSLKFTPFTDIRFTTLQFLLLKISFKNLNISALKDKHNNKT